MTTVEFCPKAPENMSNTHCDHWWDGNDCHWCGAKGMTNEEKQEQGMEL